MVFDVTLVEEPRTLTDEFRDFWGGYRVEFKIIDAETYEAHAADKRKLHMASETVVDDNGKKFPIDISKYEYVAEKAAELVDDFTVYAYSPQMLVAEKLRAICQQMPEYTSQLKKRGTPRGGTFLDIHTVVEHFSVDFGAADFHQTVRKIFGAKRVALMLLSKIADEASKDYHRPDFVSIEATVTPGFELQDFDFYYDYVVDKCRGLESLWSV